MTHNSINEILSYKNAILANIITVAIGVKYIEEACVTGCENVYMSYLPESLERGFACVSLTRGDESVSPTLRILFCEPFSLNLSFILA